MAAKVDGGDFFRFGIGGYTLGLWGAVDGRGLAGNRSYRLRGTGGNYWKLNTNMVKVFFCILAIGIFVSIEGCQAPVKSDPVRKISSEQQNQLDDFARKVRTEPDNTGLRIKYADKLAEVGRFSPALEQVDEILKRHPGEASALLARGRILLQANRGKEAEHCLRELLKADPRNSAAGVMLGYCCLDQGRDGEAETLFRRFAHDEGPVRQRISAYLGLAYIYAQKGQKEEVRKCYAQAIQLDESLAELLLQISQQGFMPGPVSDQEGRGGGRAPLSPGEVNRIYEEVKRGKQ